ncbi:MAG: CsgG/HfaB family protein [Treponema sp.]|nr:CsgG/HfaB family protein [Treponema sp.]
MKKIAFAVVLVVLMVGWMGACASITDVYRPLSGVQGADVLGTIQTEFESVFAFMPGTYPGASKSWKRNVDQAAYNALLEAARKEYTGNIDVYDVTFTVVHYASRQNNMNKYRATGRVVSLGGSSGRTTTGRTGIEGALQRAAEEVSESFTARSRLAIVYITAQDRGQTDYITGELEHILRRMGYVIIDRSELDKIRTEQRFGASGEVDDNTAARIGQLAGASVIITGRIDGEGSLRRLRLRALDTSSARVVGTASEPL